MTSKVRLIPTRSFDFGGYAFAQDWDIPFARPPLPGYSPAKLACAAMKPTPPGAIVNRRPVASRIHRIAHLLLN